MCTLEYGSLPRSIRSFARLIILICYALGTTTLSSYAETLQSSCRHTICSLCQISQMHPAFAASVLVMMPPINTCQLCASEHGCIIETSTNNASDYACITPHSWSCSFLHVSFIFCCA